MNRRTRIILAAAAVAGVAVVLIIVALSGGSDQASTTASGGAPQGLAQPSQDLQDCLTRNGVTIPSGAPTGAAPTGDQTAAIQACQKYLPSGAPTGGFPQAPPSQ
jgi:hypothetical protein